MRLLIHRAYLVRALSDVTDPACTPFTFLMGGKWEMPRYLYFHVLSAPRRFA